MRLHTLQRFAVLCAALALLAACGRALPTPDLVSQARAATVAVEAERGATVSVESSALTGAPERVATAGSTSLGAGIALEEGYILTSAHLVEGAARVTVRPDGADSAPREASVVGVSLCDGLALLMTEGTALRPARLGSSAELRLGSPVVALGFGPGGGAGGPVVSEGIVSWIAPAPEGLPPASLLRTSAALAPAGSGGPLLSPGGEVVGIMTAGRFSSAAGPGDYVIGIDYARRVAEELRERGSVLSLGLDLIELGGAGGELYRRAVGADAVAGGLFVRAVAPGSPAAGVQPGDILVAAAGRPLGSLADLCAALGGPGVTLPAELELVRRSDETAERVVAALGAEAAAVTAPPDLGPPAAESTGTTGAASRETAPRPAPTPAPAPAAAVGSLDPGALQAAREALAAERALQRELLFETFDSETTKTRWRPGDDAAGARELVFAYYRLSLKQPGAVVSDAWADRLLGARYIVELEVALPQSGGAAAGIAFDQQADGNGLSTFMIGADGSWQLASFQGGALVPGRYARGFSPAFVQGGGTNFLRVVRLPEGTQLWLNDTLVAQADPGPFQGGHAGVIAIAGPEPLPQPAQVIVDNFRVLEHP